MRFPRRTFICLVALALTSGCGRKKSDERGPASKSHAESVESKTLGPLVIMATPSVFGDLDGDALKKLGSEHEDVLRQCYEKGLAENPKLAGRVILACVVAPGGASAECSVGSSPFKKRKQGPEVAQCIADAVSKWSFPLPGGDEPVKMGIPFDLSAG